MSPTTDNDLDLAAIVSAAGLANDGSADSWMA